LLAAAPSFANTYLFSFTASQLQAALLTAEGPAAYNESAYFAIFVQPDPLQISNYSYLPVSSPNPTGDNPWSADVIDDPANPALGYSLGNPCTADCEWAGFYKGPTQSDVTVVSGTSIFLGGAWASFGTPPIGWGMTFGTIQDLMPGSSVFSFSINTASVLSGSYTIRGYASRLQSGDPGYMTEDTKEDHGISFSLSAEAMSSVPEPSTLVFGAFGVGAILLARSRRKSHSNPVN
jgi:hypothetical protein